MTALRMHGAPALRPARRAAVGHGSRGRSHLMKSAHWETASGLVRNHLRFPAGSPTHRMTPGTCRMSRGERKRCWMPPGSA